MFFLWWFLLNGKDGGKNKKGNNKYLIGTVLQVFALIFLSKIWNVWIYFEVVYIFFFFCLVLVPEMGFKGGSDTESATLPHLQCGNLHDYLFFLYSVKKTQCSVHFYDRMHTITEVADASSQNAWRGWTVSFGCSGRPMCLFSNHGCENSATSNALTRSVRHAARLNHTAGLRSKDVNSNAGLQLE